MQPTAPDHCGPCNYFSRCSDLELITEIHEAQVKFVGNWKMNRALVISNRDGWLSAS
jgi:hypothetical protein